ncbi:MAG TPA: alanine--glyoxylate aminotransferase family protein [Phycisphaerae bacterium]|nr:alanine--glyoxylate aminotransferase family protein [Phycisphaerae bacterium]HOJ72963.1 alanine--glyoxylate aminotransferase family protein [Phycisphaerae bacterium]HOM50147.1 alanine--glyoxylate aminotransferase family protein [Phycisphaerae bacterium]HON69303.1 alanine--glyoxylate aminotransferase family protein [Phycisphaerae bacterium]HOQ84334.1 alanine--glyoxylate aminotransferase family protein [Phycisphaerae bacterium]
MRKLRLFSPGPTMVPPEVTAAMAGPFDHHRTAAHRAIFREVTENLQYVFQTSASVCIVTGSGTAAMESAIVGVGAPNSKALVLCGGKFGERWAKVCKSYRINHVAHQMEWGTAPSGELVAELLAKDSAIDTVIVTHCETSTAAAADLQAIAEVTRRRDCLLVVDGITSVGALPVRMDEWGVDVVVTSSQKALMTPPGLGFVAVSERAWKRIDSFASPALYLCLKAYRQGFPTQDHPYTPAITLLRGLQVALRMMREEGMENIWRRTATLARATRAAVEAMGLRVFARNPSDSLTAVLLPEGFDEPTFRRRLREEYGILVAGGQDQLKGRIFRINHMGYVDATDTLGAIAAFEMLLSDMGHSFPLGAGVAAAMQAAKES